MDTLAFGSDLDENILVEEYAEAANGHSLITNMRSRVRGIQIGDSFHRRR